MPQTPPQGPLKSSHGLLAAMVIGLVSGTPTPAQGVDLDQLCMMFPQNSRCEGYQPQPWKTHPDLGQGKAVAEHERDQFQGQVLIPAPQEQVWQVLTDYNNFEDFLPGVIENQATVTSEMGDRRTLIMTSTSVTQVFLAQFEASIELELIETPTSQIGFSLVSGDSLSQLNGSWQLETITPPNSSEFQGQDTATLVTYRAHAATTAGPQGVFAGIFKDQIRKNLTAIQQETLRRFSSPS